MAKRAKKAPFVADHPAPPPYAPVGDDYTRARFKIQSLQDDYEDLAKENDAMKQRLQEAKHKKRILLAQVKFLRDKYRFLMENPRNLSFPQQQRIEECQKMRPPKSSKASLAAHPEKPVSFHTTTHPQHQGGIDIQPSMRMDKSNKETTSSRKKLLVLDLNETSVPFMDEPNEFHHSSWSTNPPPASWEKQLQPQYHHPPEPVDTTGAAADLKLSACRSVGKDAAARAGKRKITWQDQVALRV